MSAMVRQSHPHARTLWLPVTPELRRILALVAETAIDLLDEFDRPTADLEADADFEEAEATEDDDPGEESDPLEENQDDEGDKEGDGDLGWAEDSFGAGTADTGNQFGDEDFVTPETSGGFGPSLNLSRQQLSAMAETFDPRLARRPVYDDLTAIRPPMQGLRFPHEAPGGPPFDLRSETGRLVAMASRRRSHHIRRI
jgi:hypothetical protein